MSKLVTSIIFVGALFFTASSCHAMHAQHDNGPYSSGGYTNASNHDVPCSMTALTELTGGSFSTLIVSFRNVLLEAVKVEMALEEKRAVKKFVFDLFPRLTFYLIVEGVEYEMKPFNNRFCFPPRFSKNDASNKAFRESLRVLKVVLHNYLKAAWRGFTRDGKSVGGFQKIRNHLREACAVLSSSLATFMISEKKGGDLRAVIAEDAASGRLLLNKCDNESVRDLLDPMRIVKLLRTDGVDGDDPVGEEVFDAMKAFCDKYNDICDVDVDDPYATDSEPEDDGDPA